MRTWHPRYASQRPLQQGKIRSSEASQRSRHDLGQAFRGGQARKFRGINPPGFGKLLVQAQFAVPPPSRKSQNNEMSRYATVRIAHDDLAMAGKIDRLYGQAGFFMQFAHHGLLERLPDLDATAR
jgi:hypothetical protein